MQLRQKTTILFFFFGFLIFVVIGSILSVMFWSRPTKSSALNRELVIRDAITIAEFGSKNNISTNVLEKIFKLQSKSDLNKKIADLNLSQDEFASLLKKGLVLQAEYESKNWNKIFIKFLLWIVFLAIIFFLFLHNKIVPQLRKRLYFIAVVGFGIVLGSDPSPMGTIKDAIVLFGKDQLIFFPRLVALTVFLVLVVLANKFICSWGCQLGTLQDYIFRLNREPNDKKGILKQVKPPFLLTNTIRIIFFIIIILAAVLWSVDIVEPIDPFKIFNPLKLGIIGIIFIGIILIASLFIYRPWCHCFCPFGLVGWIFEKVSLYKINVTYETCIACEQCAKACPSTVMAAILKQNHTIPDCFACGTCINTCPTKSIRFELKKRNQPPVGKFK
jgi:polyferredoxin